MAASRALNHTGFERGSQVSLWHSLTTVGPVFLSLKPRGARDQMFLSLSTQTMANSRYTCAQNQCL